MPILESALGIEKVYEIATASAEIAALTIGLEDYTADLGVVKTRAGTESLFARQRVVNAARAAGVQPIDSVFGDVGDTEALRTYALNSRALGFEGMGASIRRRFRDPSGVCADRDGNRSGAKNRCRLRRGAETWHGRGQPGIEDDRCSGGGRAQKLVARAEAGSGAKDEMASRAR